MERGTIPIHICLSVDVFAFAQGDIWLWLDVSGNLNRGGRGEGRAGGRALMTGQFGSQNAIHLLNYLY